MKLNNLIVCMLLVTIFTLGGVYASADVDNMTNDINHEESEFSTDELDLSQSESILVEDVKEIENDKEFLGCSTETVNAEIIPINTVADFQEGNFTFKLINHENKNSLANQSVNISMSMNGLPIFFINNESSLKTMITLVSDENGIITLNNEKFMPLSMIGSVNCPPAGNYNVSIVGNDRLNLTNNTFITINKIDANIYLESFNEYYGTSKKIIAVITNPKTNKPVSGVHVLLNITNIGWVGYLMSDENGTIRLDVSNLNPDEYNLTISTNDTNLNEKNFSDSFRINKIFAVIDAENFSKNYDDDSLYIFNITEDGWGLANICVGIRVYFDSENFDDYVFMTYATGSISFRPHLDVGIHKVIIYLVDTRYDAGQITRFITVYPSNASINISNAVFNYSNEYIIPFSFEGAIDIDAKLNVSGEHISKGNNTLIIKNLMPGNYSLSISAITDKNHNTITKNVTITVNKLNPNLSMKINSVEESNPITVIVTTNQMFSGNLSVKIGMNNYLVYIQNGSGVLKVPSLPVGKYLAKVICNSSDMFDYGEITTSFKVFAKKASDASVKNKIKLTLKKVTVKKSAKKLVLKATLKINGKVVKGKKITFKFNKKTYKAATNKKGVAKVTIKKSVLKKLKVGKKVKYQASYGKTTVKKTVKVKK